MQDYQEYQEEKKIIPVIDAHVLIDAHPGDDYMIQFDRPRRRPEVKSRITSMIFSSIVIVALCIFVAKVAPAVF